nr:adhesive plaque matrix protein-like isoform X1 [Labrus bergylta]
MVCGVNLRILLICLVHAEHICCLWATQAQSFQRQNGNGYVGYSQQESGVRRLGGSNPQNQLRQASVSPGSAQTSSINTQAAVHSVYSEEPSSSGFSQTLSKPAQGGHSSVRFVQRNSVSKPNWQTLNQKVHEPKKSVFGLSTAIASGSSVSKYSEKPSALTDTSRNMARPVQQAAQSASKYLSSSSASLQRPSSKSPSQLASYQSLPQNAPISGAGTSYVQGRYAAAQLSSSLFNPAWQGTAVQTSATAPAKRVSLHRTSKTSYPSSTLNNYFPSQIEGANSYQHAQGRYSPSSLSSKQNAAGFQPRSVQMPNNQGFSYTATEQNSMSPVQGVRNPAASGRSAGQRYAPTRTHNIPEHFGGSVIRRLTGPEGSVRNPQQTYLAPSAQTVNYNPQVQSIRNPQQTYSAPSAQTVNYNPQVQSIRNPQQTYSAPSAQTVNYNPQVQSIRNPQQTYSAPSAQTVNYNPQVQSIRNPQQTYSAPSAQTVNYNPQVQSIRKPQQTYSAPSAQTVNYNPQQTYSAPPAQTVNYKPQVQSIRNPQQTYSAPSAQTVNYKPQVQSIRNPQQTYSAPSAQTVNYNPQVQSIRKPQQTYSAPSAQTVNYNPQVQSIRKPQQTYSAPSAQTVNYKPQVQSLVKQEQTYTAPSVQSVSYMPKQSLSGPSGHTVLRKPDQKYTASSAPKPQDPKQAHAAPSAQLVSYKPLRPRQRRAFHTNHRSRVFKRSPNGRGCDHSRHC